MFGRSKDLIAAHAPDDVRATIGWLLANGYALSSEEGDGTFGAQLVYTGPAVVRVTVDRSQWMADIAARPGAPFVQYDLAVAAHSGVDYGECFPDTGRRTGRLPEQLPDGVSWRATLPDLLAWIGRSDVTAAVERARRQRVALLFPDSPDLDGSG